MAWSKEWNLSPSEPIKVIENVWEAIKEASLIPENMLKKVYSNKMPTHDPYTNPDTHIYYQCACGAILDPGTKSFAALNNAASDAGWKVRWGSETYVPYCVECGKDVE